MKDRTALGVYRLLNPNYKSDTSKSMDQIFSPNSTNKIMKKKLQWRDALKNAEILTD
jgi:muramidase (phage lysozyme)